MILKYRKGIFFVFALWSVISIYFLFQLKFTFDFEQFFPEGDSDLAFFQEFVEDFETDDNFLLIAVQKESGIFDSTFLNKFHDFSLQTRNLPHVTQSRSLTQLRYPIKTPFAITSIPVIHINQPNKYTTDSINVLNDPRFVYNLVDEKGQYLVVFLRLIDGIQLDQARALMSALNDLIQPYKFDQYHYLGRPYFQQELVDMQKREITFSAIVSGILVTIVMWLIYRRPIGILISLVSIAIGMLLFMGVLGALGRPLNAMAALYPVLMIIVGTSDVIHIMSKYIAELRKGKTRADAIRTTTKEIGLATLLTSTTTAIGFASLLTARIAPVRDFGINAAIGVVVAYITVIFFTTAWLSFYGEKDIVKTSSGKLFWESWLAKFNSFTAQNPKTIVAGSIIAVLICALGIFKISTNYNIINNFPKGKKITKDFLVFEENLTSFRPFEIAVTTQDPFKATDYEVLSEIDKVENKLGEFREIQAVNSITTVYKSINRMYHGNQGAYYTFPDDAGQFVKYQKVVDQFPYQEAKVLVNQEGNKARISARIKDIGADHIKTISDSLQAWINLHTNPDVATFRQTGTGLIIDKNAEYVRKNLIEGLGLAVLIVGILMALLFKNWKMLLISLVPNIFPLLVAGALLGYLGIDLEAGVSIVFAVIFGIAVDDTIHFLSKYKLALQKGLNTDEALEVTFAETGKAICLTSIILFFGFLIMLFSIHPPSVTIGLLISITLLSALFSDLLLIPVMIRWLIPQKSRPSHQKT